MEASTEPQLSPLLLGVDPILLPGSNSDERYLHLRSGTRRTFVLGSPIPGLAARAWIGGREAPLWLQPSRVHHIRVTCEDFRWEGVARTEPGTSLGAGGDLEASNSCARFLVSGSWFPANSAAYAAAVDAPPGCAWQAATGASWILVTANSGNGAGQVSFTLEANTGPMRSSAILLDGQIYAIRQLGASEACVYQISAPATGVPAVGGGYVIAVQTSPGCSWSAVSPADWIRVLDGQRGSGSGTVTIAVDPNPGNVRATELLIAGQALRIDQFAGACTVRLAPPSAGPSPIGPASLPASGGTYELHVQANSGCEWSSSTNASWIRISSGFGGSGPGVIRYSVEPNGPQERSAQISAGAVSATIRQEAAACNFRLNTASSWFPPSGGTYKIDLTAPDACPWSATSPVTWARLTAVSPKPGGFLISVQLEENWYAARTASLRIAGVAYQLQQTGHGWPPGCSIRLGSGPSTWFPANTGQSPSTLTVSAPAGCAWTAASNAPWLRITSGEAGVGSGALTYLVQSNSGGTRSAAITVGLQRFVVNQSGASCDFFLSYSESWFPAAGGLFEVAATGPPECSYTAASAAPWIQDVAPASGSGSAVIRFRLERNGTGASREGQLDIGGKKVTVRQSP
ncbi:MAG: BACON domain-containing protein [Bryobacterales bacterium]|nr:BACON domain-containing protein [Bryobacterales bacterium]